MRHILLFLGLSVFVSCTSSTAIEKEIASIPVDVNIERFDLIFGETTLEKLPNLKEAYPFLFSKSIPDEVWEARLEDSLQIELRNEVKKTFSNFKPQYLDIQNLFKHLKYYYPEFNEPRVITLISDVDYRNKVKVTDSLLLISLDTYLGSNHKYYENIYGYIKKNMKPSQMVSDIAAQYAYKSIYSSERKMFLDEMIYFGKELYFKDKIIPFKTDAEKIGYTNEEYDWATVNEQYIWQHFVKHEMLFDTNSKLVSRFITPAPFSKFNLELDAESPGQLGRFIGWQIVRSYMQNNDITLDEMLKKDALEIFNNSKYKPRK